MNRRLVGLILIFWVMALPALALTWQEATQIGAKNSYSLKSAAAQSENARWNYYQALTNFLPQLSANASVGNNIIGTTGTVTQGTGYGLSLSQTLFSGMDNYLNGLSTKNDFESALANQRQVEAQYYYDLRAAFIDLKMAEEDIAIYKEILTRRESDSALIELRFESGREDRGVLMRTKADQDDATFNVVSAKRQRGLSNLKLNQLLSCEVEAVVLTGEAVLPPQPNYQELFLQAPAMEMAWRKVATARYNQERTVKNFLPSVTLNGSYRMNDTNWPPQNATNGWNLNLSYPFFSGGSNITARVAAGAQLDKAEQDFRQTRDTLMYQLQAAYEGLADALDALRVADAFLKAMTQRAEIARTKYLNGLISYDDWGRIENEYINYKKSYNVKKKAAWLAEATWYKAWGGYIK